jgi:hypothetical protein
LVDWKLGNLFNPLEGLTSPHLPSLIAGLLRLRTKLWPLPSVLQEATRMLFSRSFASSDTTALAAAKLQDLLRRKLVKSARFHRERCNRSPKE